jgi:hypothetical protein
MQAAGFTDYSEFIKAVYTAIQKHAESANWIPVDYNLCDEPIGDAINQSINFVTAYRKAFPKGPPYFSIISSYTGNDPNDAHLRLGTTAHIANWNGHSEDALKLLKAGGSDWAFYNGGNRWTLGDYMFKCVREYDMKFRYHWHYSLPMGDPYYALDGREDDAYSWVNTTPDGTLIPALKFERYREGLNDYRRLITLERLAKAKNDQAALKIIEDRMKTFKLGQRDHDAVFPDNPVNDWQEFRTKVSDAIERLR